MLGYCCSQGSICFEMMKGVPAGAATLLAGVIVAAITWRQYKVAQAKLKLDLFDKRLAIFMKVWEVTAETFNKGPRHPKFGNYGLGSPYNELIPEIGFLFGKKMEAYIDELIKNWARYRAIEGLKPEEAANHIEEAEKLQNYFLEQGRIGVKDRFAPFLDFANWK
jgi:hypothetical protein